MVGARKGMPRKSMPGKGMPTLTRKDTDTNTNTRANGSSPTYSIATDAYICLHLHAYTCLQLIIYLIYLIYLKHNLPEYRHME